MLSVVTSLVLASGILHLVLLPSPREEHVLDASVPQTQEK